MTFASISNATSLPRPVAVARQDLAVLDGRLPVGEALEVDERVEALLRAAVDHDLALRALRSHARLSNAGAVRATVRRLGHALRDAAGGRAARRRPRAAGRGGRSTPTASTATTRAPSGASRLARGAARLRARPARCRSRRASTPRPPAAPAATSSQSAVRDFSPGRPSTSSPPASSIICGTQWPPMNTGSSHSSAATRGRGAPSTASRTASSRRRPPPPAARPPRAPPAASARRGTSASTSPIVDGSSEITSRPRGQPAGRGDHVVEGDRAHLAHGLGHDQVGLELAQRGLVELVERLARPGPLAHGARRSPAPRGPRGSRCA